MELRDLLITPVVVLTIYLLAFSVKNFVTTQKTKIFFIPALTLKILGAIALGVIYQFYYDGGDTYNYFHQSQYIYQSLFDSPLKTLNLFLANGEFDASTFLYSQHIYWYESPTEYLVIKVAAFFGIFCLSTYSSIAVMFAVLSFSGLWAAYLTFLKEYPRLYIPIGFALFFMPSVFFWGSGLMKDTIAISALGWLFYTFHNLFVTKTRIFSSIIILLVALYVLYTIRVFVLLSFIPPAILWIFLENSNRIKNLTLRWICKPLLLILGLTVAYIAGTNITKGDVKYDIDEIGKRTKINAEYLYRISLEEGGSAYHLGNLDGTIEGMLRLAPKALVVTLFRPYPWEVKNVMMFLSAVESFIFLLLTIRLIINPGILSTLRSILQHPMLLFCVLYSVGLAIAVGLNSYNFGSLVRYKVQILPFFLSTILIIGNLKKNQTLLKSSS